MNDIDKFVVCDERHEVKSRKEIIRVWAWIKDGCLRISEHTSRALNDDDSWEDVPKSILSREFDYYFDSKNTKRLIKLLRKGDTPIENALASRFGGIEGRKVLREFCSENKIEYDTFYE